MTVEMLSGLMSHAELVEWHALDEIRAEERETAQRQAEAGMKARRR